MKQILTILAILLTALSFAQGNPELNSVTLLGEASNPTLVEGKLIYNSTTERAYIGNSTAYQMLGDFLADGSIPMTGQLSVNNVGGVQVSATGSSNSVVGMATLGFYNFTGAGMGAKFIFGDDFNGIFNSYGNGLLYNSYHTQYFRQATTAPTDGDLYPNQAGVSFEFQNAQNRTFKIYEANATSNADFIQFVQQEGTVLARIDVNGVYNGLIAFDNTTSGLTATDQKAAIDEVEGRVDAIEAGASGIPSDVTGLTNAQTVTNIVRGAKDDIDGWAADASRLDICTDCANYTEPQSDNNDGSTLDIQYSGGYWYDMNDGNPETVYTLSATRLGGWAVVKVNAPSEPSITGATKIPGATFSASTDMYMYVFYNGSETHYYFAEI